MIPLFSNRIRTYAISNNYLGHLEHPDDAHFGATEPTSVEDIGQGSTKPNLNRYADGSAGVAKYDPLSVGFEPFGHHLSAAIGGEKLFPRTVVRGSKSKPYSLQQAVPGVSGEEYHGNLSNPLNRTKMLSHPDLHSIYLTDYATKNNDRHDGNFMYDTKTNRVHGIDNAYVADTWNSENHNSINQNLRESNQHAPIPQDFRDRVSNMDLDAHKRHVTNLMNHPTFDKAITARQKMFNGYDGGPAWYPHAKPEEVKQQFLDDHMNRLGTLQTHLRDPQVQTMGDMYKRLYPKAK